MPATSDLSGYEFRVEIEQRGGTVDFFAGCVRFPENITIHAMGGDRSNREQLAHVLREYDSRRKQTAAIANAKD